MNKKKVSIVGVVLMVILAVVVYTQITLFVIQPIGAIPEGKTLVILRPNNGEFVDSADAMCERTQGGVSLFCRMGALGAVAKNSKIIMRLPYSESLYLASTNGSTYSQ